MVASAGTKNVRFKPLKDWVGKKLESPELSGSEVWLKSLGSSTVDVRTSPRAMIKGVLFEHPDGSRADYYGRSGGGTPTSWVWTYNVEVEPDGAMVLQVYQDLKKVTIPIDLKDVPLP